MRGKLQHCTMACQEPMRHWSQRVRTRDRRAHPGVSCNENALRFVPAAYLRALPVYLPVYLLSGLLVHRYALNLYNFLGNLIVSHAFMPRKQCLASCAPQALLITAGCMHTSRQPSLMPCPAS